MRVKSTLPTHANNADPDFMADTKGRLHVIAALAGSDGAQLPVSEGDYETVAASQSDQVLGATGAAGDYLDTLVITVATAATAATSIKDGGGSAIPILPNSPGGGIGVYVVPIKAKSVAGAWKVTTGAGATVLATGVFT